MEVAFLGQEQVVTLLVQYFSSTPEYQELRQAADKLRQNPRLFQRLSDFKAAASSGQLSQTQMDALGREYQALAQFPEVKRYFVANDRFSELMGGIINSVNTALQQLQGI